MGTIRKGRTTRVRLALLLVAAAVALAGCVGGSHLVSSRGHWEPTPDPQDGRVYNCCWYPHGFYHWVPDRSGVSPSRVQER